MRIWLKAMGVVCLLTAALPLGVGLLLLASLSSGHVSEDAWRWLRDALAGEIEPVQLVVLSFAVFLVILSCVAFGLASKLCVLESLARELSRLRNRGDTGNGSDAAPRREERETMPEWLRAMGWLCLVPALLLARYLLSEFPALSELSAPWAHIYALGAVAVALVTLSCLSFAVARSLNLEHKIASGLGRLGAPSLEPAGDNTAGQGARTRVSGLRGAGLRSWLVALGVLCLLPAPIIAYDLLVSTIIYTVWPRWSHVALIFAGASVYALVVAGSLALASARGLGLLRRIAERLPTAHSPQASVRQNAYLYIGGLLCLLPIPLIVSYGRAERYSLYLEGFRALAAFIFGLTALCCISFSIAKSRRSLAMICAHVQSFESPSDADHEQETPAEGEITARSAPARPNDERATARGDETAAAAAGPRSSSRGRALVGAGILALIAIPLVNYQQALYRQGAHLGGALGWGGRYEDALTAWDWAVRSDSDDASAHHGRGAMLAQLGRYQEALAAYDRAIQLDPRYAHAHYNRGWALGELGRHEEALAAFDWAIQSDPDNPDAHHNRGWALGQLGRYEEALAAFDRAIELGPDDAGAHHKRGWSLAQLGRYEEALAAYDRAIQLAPGDATAHHGRGWSLAQLGRHQEALAALDRAIQLSPETARTHYDRACVYSLLGSKDEALRNLRTAIDLDGGLRDTARTDDDFESLHGDPEFRELVMPHDANPE